MMRRRMKLLMINNTNIFFNSLLINYKSTDRNKVGRLRVYSHTGRRSETMIHFNK